MNFVSLTYIGFFTTVFLVYWRLSRRQQNLFLMLASYLFYAYWDWRFLSLILISTLVDYVIGRKIADAHEKPDGKRYQQWWLIASIVINLGILGYFKYAGFFVDSFTSVLNSVGLNADPVVLNIILPVGISFYTFQSLSYSFDIYRRQLEPSRSLIDFAAFVAFFPQLIAGPIVRAREFLYQLEVKRTFNPALFEEGLVRFITGLFKKAFIADTLAVDLVDPVFANPAQYDEVTIFMAVLGYAVQIYCDFSGYSNMAIGSAKMLGFNLPENFNFPYLATSFSEFWGRWHMTMSRFFRDYVYIGLGGNRNGQARTYANLFLTALVSGLWHGAAWTFVAWGAIHGCFNVLNSLTNRCFKAGLVLPAWFAKSMGWIITQSVVCLAWIVFRSADFVSASSMYSGMISSPGTMQIVLNDVICIAFAAFFIDHLYGALKERVALPSGWRLRPIIGVACAVMVVWVFNHLPDEQAPFIYFQF